jgi:hypothetical protein
MEHKEETTITEEYNKGFSEGYLAALSDYLNDECTDAVIAEAREWADKKEARAHR